MNKNEIEMELKQIFHNNLGISIETKEQEEQSLFYLNSNFTPAKGTYLFAILYSKYNVDLSEIEIKFKKEMTFRGIVDYIYSHSSIQK